MKCYYTQYTVKQASDSEFPLRMLAIDDSCPASSGMAERMISSIKKGGKCEDIVLNHIGTDKGWEPDAGYWMHYGWRVDGWNTSEMKELVIETDDVIDVTGD